MANKLNENLDIANKEIERLQNEIQKIKSNLDKNSSKMSKEQIGNEIKKVEKLVNQINLIGINALDNFNDILSNKNSSNVTKHSIEKSKPVDNKRFKEKVDDVPEIIPHNYINNKTDNDNAYWMNTDSNSNSTSNTNTNDDLAVSVGNFLGYSFTIIMIVILIAGLAIHPVITLFLVGIIIYLANK